MSPFKSAKYAERQIRPAGETAIRNGAGQAPLDQPDWGTTRGWLRDGLDRKGEAVKAARRGTASRFLRGGDRAGRPVAQGLISLFSLWMLQKTALSCPRQCGQLGPGGLGHRASSSCRAIARRCSTGRLASASKVLIYWRTKSSRRSGVSVWLSSVWGSRAWRRRSARSAIRSKRFTSPLLQEGFIARTAKGRIATARAYNHFGRHKQGTLL